MSAALSEVRSAGLNGDVQQKPRQLGGSSGRGSSTWGPTFKCLSIRFPDQTGSRRHRSRGARGRGISPVHGPRVRPKSPGPLVCGRSTRVPRSPLPRMTFANGQAAGPAGPRRRFTPRHVAPIMWAVLTGESSYFGGKVSPSRCRRCRQVTTRWARSSIPTTRCWGYCTQMERPFGERLPMRRRGRRSAGSALRHARRSAGTPRTHGALGDAFVEAKGALGHQGPGMGEDGRTDGLSAVLAMVQHEVRNASEKVRPSCHKHRAILPL